MALPEGAHYVPGLGRSFVRLDNGSVVKRQTAENMAVEARGIPGVTNVNQLRKLRLFGRTEQGAAIRNSPNYQRDVERSTGLFSRGDPRGRDAKDFDDLALALSREYQDSGGQLDKSPNGVLAQYLVAAGKRNPGADYAVGESPSVK
ncbi:MAG: hypothetical protein ACREN8_00800 [Candidatus Dormibacteraceae bacterium]